MVICQNLRGDIVWGADDLIIFLVGFENGSHAKINELYLPIITKNKILRF